MRPSPEGPAALPSPSPSMSTAPFGLTLSGELRQGGSRFPTSRSLHFYPCRIPTCAARARVCVWSGGFGHSRHSPDRHVDCLRHQLWVRGVPCAPLLALFIELWLDVDGLVSYSTFSAARVVCVSLAWTGLFSANQYLGSRGPARTPPIPAGTSAIGPALLGEKR